MINNFTADTDRVTDKVELILKLLLEDPAYSYADLVNKTNLSRKTIALCIKKLKELSYIERIGSDRKGYWKIIENNVHENEVKDSLRNGLENKL